MSEVCLVVKYIMPGQGLPDGMFTYQKIPIWSILECPGMANVSIFYGHLVYFVVFWYILWPFGLIFPFWYTYFSRFGIFFPFWYIVPRKIWHPWTGIPFRICHRKIRHFEPVIAAPVCPFKHSILISDSVKNCQPN
jgi:hypothetical protein